MRPTPRTLRARGAEYAVAESGSGPPLLLLHSLGFDRRIWDAQVAGLSPHYRCLAGDLPGHGASPAPRGPRTLEEEAEGVAALLAAAGASPAHLVGLSLGALIALRVALAHPGAVRSLSLVGATAEEEIPERRALHDRLAGRARAGGAAGVEEEILPYLFGPEFLRSGGEALERCRALFRAHDPEAAGVAARAAASRTRLLERLPEIGAPVLLVVGSDDRITPPWRSKKMARALPDARLEIVAGAGHLVPAERPEEVTAILAAFLDGIERGQGPERPERP